MVLQFLLCLAVKAESRAWYVPQKACDNSCNVQTKSFIWSADLFKANIAIDGFN